MDDPVLTRNPQLVSSDRHAVAVLVSSRLKEQDIEAQVDHLRHVVRTAGWQTWVTGTAAVNHDYALSSEQDLARGEQVTAPLLLIILLLVFGSLIAAGLPLLLALFSIVVSLALVFWIGHSVSESTYVQNVVTVLGLGVSIDYSLFIVYRFREELHLSEGDSKRAVVRTMETTGRAVFFSGITVAIALSSLFLTGVSFMQGMGIGGMLVPLTALLVAMTLLPAVLGLLGARIDVKLWRVIARRLGVDPDRVRGVVTSILPRSPQGGVWHRIALGIMHRPVVWGGSALIVLLGIAYPATHFTQAYGGLKNANQTLESVSGYVFMRDNFSSTSDPAQIIVRHTGPGTLLNPAELSGMRRLESTLRRDLQVRDVSGPADGIPVDSRPTRAQLAAILGRSLSPDLRVAVIAVAPRHEVGTKANELMTRRVEQTSARFQAGPLRGNQLYVGGAAAQYIAWDDVVDAKFPSVVGLILLLTYCFLFLAFRSVFLPLKAVMLNILSVAAAYGALELVFHRGVGHQVLGFTPEDGVAPWVPIFLFAFLFGLSMDYEVLLLSRIREAWLSTHNNRASVALGLEKTGRLISSAAAIMVIAFSGFLIGHEIQLKEFGFGLMVSIALDATLIRLVLVPSIMELMGDWNWWVPAPLRSWAGRGLSPSELSAEKAGQEAATVSEAS